MKFEQLSTLEEENELQEAADRFDLGAEVPQVGTPAYERLKNICSLYTETVINHMRTNTSPVLSVSESARKNSDKLRRSIHNQLCVMLLGTSWHETPSDARRKVSDFAVSIGGREDFVGTF